MVLSEAGEGLMGSYSFMGAGLQLNIPESAKRASVLPTQLALSCM